MHHTPPVRQAAILVGGRGSRLGGLMDATPKPLLPCGDRPFLAWLLRELIRFGIEDVLLLTGYLADTVEASLPAIASGLPKPLRITCVREPQPAGTGGALFHAREHLAERFLLCNGDSWLDCNLARLLADAAKDPEDTVGRMLLRRLPDASRYGVVETEGDRVTAFRERPEPGQGETARPGTINAGVYLFDRRVLADVAAVCSLERDVMPLLAARGALRGTVGDGYFIDIGIPADLARAQTELPERLQRRALFLPQDLLIGPDHGPDLLIDSDHGPGETGDRFSVRPDAVAAIRAAAEAGWHVFVLANLSGSARQQGGDAPAGMPSTRMIAAVRAASGTIDELCEAVLAPQATRDADHAAGAHRSVLQDVLARWGLDPGRCVLIGGEDRDLAAAAAAKMPAQLGRGGKLAVSVAALLEERQDAAASVYRP